MIKKVVKKHNLKTYSEIKDNLAYWLSKPSAERISAVEFLRRQKYGDSGPIQKTARVITSHKNLYPPRKGHNM